MSDNAAEQLHQSGRQPPSVSAPAPSKQALAYWLNVHQLCDGDLPWQERRQAEQRLIDELV